MMRTGQASNVTRFNMPKLKAGRFPQDDPVEPSAERRRIAQRPDCALADDARFLCRLPISEHRGQPMRHRPDRLKKPFDFETAAAPCGFNESARDGLRHLGSSA
jgi:hypothetical protein